MRSCSRGCIRFYRTLGTQITPNSRKSQTSIQVGSSRSSGTTTISTQSHIKGVYFSLTICNSPEEVCLVRVKQHVRSHTVHTFCIHSHSHLLISSNSHSSCARCAPREYIFARKSEGGIFLKFNCPSIRFP